LAEQVLIDDSLFLLLSFEFLQLSLELLEFRHHFIYHFLQIAGLHTHLQHFLLGYIGLRITPLSKDLSLIREEPRTVLAIVAILHRRSDNGGRPSVVLGSLEIQVDIGSPEFIKGNLLTPRGMPVG
jgi:hypothetical protein